MFVYMFMAWLNEQAWCWTEYTTCLRVIFQHNCFDVWVSQTEFLLRVLFKNKLSVGDCWLYRWKFMMKEDKGILSLSYSFFRFQKNDWVSTENNHSKRDLLSSFHFFCFIWKKRKVANIFQFNIIHYNINNLSKPFQLCTHNNEHLSRLTPIQLIQEYIYISFN